MPIYSDKDPIVAIATASGRGGVGIVRLSADDSFIEGFLKLDMLITVRLKIAMETRLMKGWPYIFLRLSLTLESPY